MATETKEYRVRVLMYLDGSFVKLEATDPVGRRLHHPGFEIHRSLIPYHLRTIGSQFLLKYASPSIEDLCKGELPDPEFVVIPLGPDTSNR